MYGLFCLCQESAVLFILVSNPLRYGVKSMYQKVLKRLLIIIVCLLAAAAGLAGLLYLLLRKNKYADTQVKIGV